MQIIVETLAGSRLYGTATPHSDIDLRGVAMEPPASLLGLDAPWEQYETKQPDRVIYGLRKLCRLALANNPNILDIMFAPQEMWRMWTPCWIELFHLRGSFLSQRVRVTYGGYATAQLQRMQRPVNAQATHRRELIDQYGWDVKAGSHLIRLLLQCRDILTNGAFSPRLVLDDLDVVCSIRNGQMPQQDVVDLAQRLHTQLDSVSSALPDHPDVAAVQDWLIRTERRWLHATASGTAIRDDHFLPTDGYPA